MNQGKCSFTRSARVVAAAVILTAGLTAPVLAESSGRGEIGAVLASGNTQSRSGNVKISVDLEADKWSHKAGFAGVYVSNDLGTTAQRWEVFEQSNYQFDPHVFWFGGLRYEDDRFSGFDYQATVSTGLGRNFIDTEPTKLSAQLGVGYKNSSTRQTFDPATGLLVPAVRNSTIAAIGNAEYRHALNAATSLRDKLTIESTSSNTFLQNEVGLEVKMTVKLALAVSFAVRHNTDPPEAFKKTDTLTTVNIVYDTKE